MYIENSGPDSAVNKILAADFHHHILLQHYHSIPCKCQVQYNPTHTGRKQIPIENVFQQSVSSFFYHFFYPTLSVRSQFFENKYGESYQGEGAYLSGSVYDCSLVLTTLIGLLLVSTTY